MSTRIQFRRGTAAEWSAANPILAEGEPGVELDSLLVKVGNGVTPWGSLAYLTGAGGGPGSGAVQSVAGRTGNITLTKADVGLTNVNNTSDADKPVSNLQQTALDLKASAESPVFTGTPVGLTKAHVGLGNVNNTSDMNKPVSTAQQAAINAAKLTIVPVTQAQYDSLVSNGTVVPTTLYVIPV